MILRRRVRAILVTTLVAATAACGVKGAGDFKVIGAAEVPAGVVPTTSTTVQLPGTQTTLPSEQATIYYVRGSELVGFKVDVPAPANPAHTLAQLLIGTPPPRTRSAIPKGVQAVVTIERGVAVISVSRLLLTETSTTDQVIAIGQIVLTLTSLPGVGQAQFVADGRPIAVPIATGEIRAPGDPVTFDDYKTLIAPTDRTADSVAASS